MTDPVLTYAEAGAVADADHRSTLTMPPRRPEDTPAGCRLLAAADLRRASRADRSSSWRYEHSAAAWTARADMLSQHEAEFRERIRGSRA